MEYRLEIHRPGICDDQECLKIFTSTAPFLPLRIGDLKRIDMGSERFWLEASPSLECRARDFREGSGRNRPLGHNRSPGLDLY